MHELARGRPELSRPGAKELGGIQSTASTVKQRIVAPPPGELAVGVIDVYVVDVQVLRKETQVHTAPVVNALCDLADEIDIYG